MTIVAVRVHTPESGPWAGNLLAHPAPDPEKLEVRLGRERRPVEDTRYIPDTAKLFFAHYWA